MDLLSGYASSPDQSSQVFRIPPPPEELESGDTARERKHTVVLPRVVRIDPPRDAFLVHVRLPVEGAGVAAFMHARMAEARLRLVGKPVKTAFATVDALHVSVSRPGVLREMDIRGLVEGLREALNGGEKVRVCVRPRVIAFKGGRRVFVAVPVAEGGGALGIVRRVDDVMVACGLRRFFEKPRLHVSFGWTENDGIMPFFGAGVVPREGTVQEKLLEVVVDKVICSVGKSTYNFTLE